MTIRDALMETTATLGSNGVETPYLDALILLCHALDVSKERLLSDLREELPEKGLRAFRESVTQRLAGLPVSYIRGVKEFYGREFLVDRRVLVPRPDTELLVETALALADANPAIRRIHDCCTGSGCIAITLQAERPQLSVSASDISPAALEVAAANAARLLDPPETNGGPALMLVCSDLLDSVDCGFDLITANPPYVTSEEYAAMRERGWPEPQNALDGGDDGLDLVRRLVPSAMDCLDQNGYLCVETADPQTDSARTIMVNAGFADVVTHRDLAGRGRVTVGRKPGQEL